jgi:hypothetical protein
MDVIFNFFASSREVEELWNAVGEFPGMRLIEADSRPDKATREFDQYPATELAAQESNFSVVLWPSTAGGRPVARHVHFTRDAALALNAEGRTILSGPTFIKFHQTTPPAGEFVGPCELFFSTRALAIRSRLFEQRQIDEVAWDKHRAIVAEVKRLVRSRAVAKWRSAPVLPDIAERLRGGVVKLWLWGPTGTIW